MGYVEQIIDTAKQQHQRGELSLLELESLHDQYGVTMEIDGDKVFTNNEKNA